jgi:hypothetical protein
MSKQAKQRKQKGRQLGGLDASLVVWWWEKPPIQPDLLGSAATIGRQSHIVGFFTNSLSETKSQTSSRKLYQKKAKSCDAEIKLTHKLELMKIQRINPNIDSSWVDQR